MKKSFTDIPSFSTPSDSFPGYSPGREVSILDRAQLTGVVSSSLVGGGKRLYGGPTVISIGFAPGNQGLLEAYAKLETAKAAADTAETSPVVIGPAVGAAAVQGALETAIQQPMPEQQAS